MSLTYSSGRGSRGGGLYGSSSRQRPEHLGLDRRGQVRSPTELNRPNIASRFFSDLATIGGAIPRALLDIGGAIVGDTVGAVGRGLVPGGHPGFWRDRQGNAESQIYDSLLKPIGQSFANTADFMSSGLYVPDRVRGFSHEETISRGADRAQELSDNPGLFLLEHVGNVAIGSSIASVPLKQGARAAAGRAAGETISPKGLTRKQRRQQIQDIIDTEGPGSGLARAGKLTGDIVGRPYMRTGRAIGDTKLPNIRDAIEKGSVRNVNRNASIREVTAQVRSAVPEDRMIVTETMKAAADLRVQRATVTNLEKRVADAQAVGDIEGALALTDQHRTALAQLTEFETTNAGRIADLEATRLTPVDPMDLTSPVARDLRKVLNTDAVQGATKPFSAINRRLKGDIQGLREESGSQSMDILGQRDPSVRSRVMKRHLRDLEKELQLEGASLADYGVVTPGRLGRMNDADLYNALDVIRQNPRLRYGDGDFQGLPKVEGQLELTMIDLYERTHGLAEGSLRNRLYDDATLTPQLAETVRNLNRLLEGGEVRPTTAAASAGPPPGHTRLYRGSDNQVRPDSAVDAGPTGDFRGRYFTPDEGYARRFADDSGGELSYVDVPNAELAALRAADTPEAAYMALKEMTEGSSEVILPTEMVSRARPVFPGQPAARSADTGPSPDLTTAARQAVEDALGEAYRVPVEQLADMPSDIRPIMEAARRQLTREAEVRDLQLAERNLLDPERSALRVTQEDGSLRAMDAAAGEAPALNPHLSKRQNDVMKRLREKVQKSRRRLSDLEERATRTNVAGKANAFDNYRAATREQQGYALQWDRARKAGDLELAKTLRKQLDDARAKAQKAKVAARKDLYETTKGMQQEIRELVKEMSDAELPVGVQQALNSELGSMLSRLESAFSAADVRPSASLRKSFKDLQDAGVDLTAVDANALENLLRLGEAAEGDVAMFRDAARKAEDAVRGNAEAVNQVRKVRNILEAQTRARVAQRDLNRLERRLDSVDGRLTDVDVNAMDAARVRMQDSADLAASIAERAGVKKSSPRTPSGKRALEDRLLRDQVKARLRQGEVDRASAAVDRIEAKFADIHNELLGTVEAAPAVARPFLEVTRRLDDLDATLRAEGLTQLADDLNLKGLPQTLQAMNDAGVSPTFLRRLEERLGATAQRAANEGPVKSPTMSAARRRGMSDMEVRRDLDRVKAETDIELATKVLTDEFLGEFNQNFGRSQDQIAAHLVESGRLNWDAWLDMGQSQKAKVLADAGYNAYDPGQIFAFRTRKVGDGGVWIPQSLNESLTQYAKKGSFEKFLSDWINPGTTLWKHGVLALRPAWHVYNIVGNAAMMTFAGGMSARAYLNFMRPGSEAHTLLRRHRLGWDLSEYKLDGAAGRSGRELFEAGMSRDLAPNQRMKGRVTDALVEPESLKGLLDSRAARSSGRLMSKGKQLIGASYRTNAFFDNLNRASMYLYDVNRAGLPVDQAIRHANRVLGEYTKMTPFEKMYVRSVFPFYAWMRHITRLSFDMLKPENITRASLFATLVDTLGEPNGDEAFFPQYMEGDIMLPDMGIDALDGVALGMRGFNPWQDVLDVAVYNDQLSFRGAGRSMHPLIQFGLERNSGTSQLTGRPFSRPVPVMDDMGREIPTPPPLLKHMFDTFAPPQAQLLGNIGRAAVGRDEPRYSTGDPVLIEGARKPQIASGVGSFFGVPLRFPDTDMIQERREASYDRSSRALERYQLEVEEYEQQRQNRSLPEKLIPFYG